MEKKVLKDDKLSKFKKVFNEAQQMPNSFVEKKIENLNFETELEKKRKAIESFINEIELEIHHYS